MICSIELRLPTGLEEPGRTYCRSVAYYLPKSFGSPVQQPSLVHSPRYPYLQYSRRLVHVSACITYDFPDETFLATSTLTGLAPYELTDSTAFVPAAPIISRPALPAIVRPVFTIPVREFSSLRDSASTLDALQRFLHR